MLKGPIAASTIKTTLVLSLRLLIQACSLLLLARMFGPIMFGVFAGIASLAIVLGTLSALGTNLILLGEMSKSYERRKQVLSYAIPLTSCFGCFVLVAFWLIANWIFPVEMVTWYTVLALGIADIVIQPLFGLISTEQHALGKVARAQLMQNCPLIIRLLAAVSIYFFESPSPLHLYSLGYLLSSIIALVLGGCFLTEKWPSWREWRFPNSKELRSAFSFSAINVSRLGPGELDKTLALNLVGPEDAGTYAAGARAVGAITLPVTAMTLSALPKLFREANENGYPSFSVLKWMYGAALLYSFLLSIGIFFSSPLIFLFFGSDYLGVEEVVKVLSLSIPAVALRLVSGNYLMANGMQWFRVATEVFGVSILILGALIMSASLEIKGLVIAVVLSEWVMAVIGCLIILRFGRAKN